MTDRTEATATPSLGQHRGAFDVGAGRRSRRLLARWTVAVGAGLLCVGLLLLAVVSVERSELRLLANDGERQLDLHAAQLAGQLARYDYLPQVLSTDVRLAELLRAPGDAARAAELNRALEEAAAISGAAEVYLMNADGLTIAASNWQSERTFIGRFFHYRPYFQQAMAGQPGRYFALGSTSGLRGYYFAHPIRDRGKVLGAIVVKVDMSNAEAHLAGLGQEVLVTDPDGVVFISTRREWRFRTLAPLSDDERRRLRESLRYPGVDFAPCPLNRRLAGPTQMDGSADAGGRGAKDVAP